MKQILIGIFLFSFATCTGQTPDFDTLLAKLRVSLENDDYKVKLPVIYKGEDFNVSLSESSLGFKEKEIVLVNPKRDSTFPI